MKRIAAIGGGLAVAAALLVAAPAGAEIATTSNGVGVCFSQLALDPSQVGATHLGEAIKGMAGPDLPSQLDGARNACGEPPGPGHLR